MKELKGVIAAAGRGLRLYPYTVHIPKVLLNIDGVPILKRNIELMRDALGINEIYVLVRYEKDKIMRTFGDGNTLGVNIKYLDVRHDKGLAEGLLSVKEYIDDVFCLILGDEIYLNSNHREMLKLLDQDFSVVCAIKEAVCPRIIKHNYTVEIRDGLITSLIEKPETVRNNCYLGCGTFLLKPDVLKYIKTTPVSSRTKRVELIDVINLIANTEDKVYPFMLKCEYMNINNIDEYNAANYLVRSSNFDKKKISLVVPAYNEEATVGYVIDDFKDKVDEIIVVNNNSKDNTEKIAREKGARVLSGNFRGYGDALKFGMDNARGDIFILTEADGSFLARDIGKILEYLKDADMVLGTRTTSQMIEQGANMDFLLRLGNLIVAKLIELLWLRKHEPRLTDVGCTYRGIWRSVYYEIRKSLKGVGPEFSPEMIIEAMCHNKRVIEIPVTYCGRIGGESKFSGSILASLRTALRMLVLIISKKVMDILDKLVLLKQNLLIKR